jgi:hypothetical protein
MISRFTRFVLPVTVALCGVDTANLEPAKNQKLEDARRSAEDAESKAHEMRLEKNRNTAKNGN